MMIYLGKSLAIGLFFAILWQVGLPMLGLSEEFAFGFSVGFAVVLGWFMRDILGPGKWG